MPNSQYNVGFYIKYNFQPGFLTLVCKRTLIHQPLVISLELVEIDHFNLKRDQDKVILKIKLISSKLRTGLDYTDYIVANISADECSLIFIKKIEF